MLIQDEGQSGWYLSVASLNAVGLHPDKLRFYNTLRDGKVLERLTKTSAVSKNLTEEGTWAVGDCTREGADCATLLKPGVSYTKNVVEEQIRAGRFNLTISHVGSDLIRIVEGVKSTTQLFYWWEPDAAIRDARYVRVMLDDVTHCNISRSGFPTYIPDNIPCDFPYIALSKGGNRKKLLVEEPWGIVEYMKIPQADMDWMLRTIGTGDSTSQEVACRWLEENEITWGSWLKKAETLEGRSH